MKDYFINNNTLAIIPYGTRNSLVYEENDVYLVNQKPNNIIRVNCLYNGSTLEGRLNSTRVLTGYTYKAPIVVEEKENLIFFPTSSPRLKDCSWLNLSNINKYSYDSKKDVSVITFNNNQKLEMCISLNVLNNQILRATRLDSQLRKNKYKKIPSNA